VTIEVKEMDGWRGSKLGYAGGRTGWLSNYANNDSLRGSTNNNYNRLSVNRDTATLFISGLTMVTGLYMLADYRGRNKLLKKMKQISKPVGKPVKNTIDKVMP
tara:strand:- start:117 stop:425 length:309 start_codon:yes stop_codon:yes gene_type:complete